MMSMEEQIRRMKLAFPAFRIVLNGGWHVIWEGPLRPLAKTYTVRVALTLKDWLGDMRVMAPFPMVFLITPRLQTSTPRAPGVVVPHVYQNQTDLTRSRLCLFDPASNEWSRDMAIAESTIPWTIDWLATYEGWLATGQWRGGGREHG